MVLGNQNLLRILRSLEQRSADGLLLGNKQLCRTSLVQILSEAGEPAIEWRLKQEESQKLLCLFVHTLSLK